jgi:hypothetical protein
MLESRRALTAVAGGELGRAVSRTFDLSVPEKGQWFESSQNACKHPPSERYPGRPVPPVRFRSPATQTHSPPDDAKKTCKYRPFRERLMGFEPTTFCMASSRSAAPRMQKRLQIGMSGRLDATLPFQELCGDTGG